MLTRPIFPMWYTQMIFLWQWTSFLFWTLFQIFVHTRYWPLNFIPLYQKSNEFIEHKIKTIKISLITAKASGISIDYLLQTLRFCSKYITYPFPDILHNCTDECPALPSTPLTLKKLETIWSQKDPKEDHHDKRHRAQPLSDLSPG